MPQPTNKISQFWQELKRRKVFRVVAMYAGAAYIIIELVNNVSEPLHLPEWTATVVILLLIIGFPIVAILSWIFDITPEGVQKTESIEVAKEQEPPSISTKRRQRASDVIIVVLVVVVGIMAYPKIFKKDKFKDIRDEDGRISIAVMPFENQTGDTTLNWFQRGISSLIINGLGTSSELVVRDNLAMYEMMERVNQVFTAKISPSRSKEVAEKARAEIYISGSYLGRKGTYWIMANLINTKSGDIIWTGKVEGDLQSSEYLDLANSLCNEIKNYLEIKVLEKKVEYDFKNAYTYSAEAFKHYIEGMNLFLTKDYLPAIESLKKAYEIDSTFTLASFYIAMSYNFGLPKHDKRVDIWVQKAYETKDRLPLKYQYWIELWYASYISKSLPDLVRYYNLLVESGIESRLLWYDLAITYWDLTGQSDKAIIAFEKIEEINQELSEPWEYEEFYLWYGIALCEAGKHLKEKEILELSLRLFPNEINKKQIYLQKSHCALLQGDTTAAIKYLNWKKYIK